MAPSPDMQCLRAMRDDCRRQLASARSDQDYDDLTDQLIALGRYARTGNERGGWTDRHYRSIVAVLFGVGGITVIIAVLHRGIDARSLAIGGLILGAVLIYECILNRFVWPSIFSRMFGGTFR